MNTTGQKFVAKLLAEHPTRLGHDRAGQILTTNIGPPVYVLHTITASSSITRRYLPETYSATAAGTKMTRIDNLISGGDHLGEVVAASGPFLRKATNRTYLELNGVDQRTFVRVHAGREPTPGTRVYRKPHYNRGGDNDNDTCNSPRYKLARRLRQRKRCLVGPSSRRPDVYGGLGSVTGIRIGRGVINYSVLDIAEVIVWNRALTPSELATTRTDLMPAAQPVVVLT